MRSSRQFLTSSTKTNSTRLIASPASVAIESNDNVTSNVTPTKNTSHPSVTESSTSHASKPLYKLIFNNQQALNFANLCINLAKRSCSSTEFYVKYSEYTDNANRLTLYEHDALTDIWVCYQLNCVIQPSSKILLVATQCVKSFVGEFWKSFATVGPNDTDVSLSSDDTTVSDSQLFERKIVLTVWNSYYCVCRAEVSSKQSTKKLYRTQSFKTDCCSAPSDFCKLNEIDTQISKFKVVHNENRQNATAVQSFTLLTVSMEMIVLFLKDVLFSNDATTSAKLTDVIFECVSSKECCIRVADKVETRIGFSVDSDLERPLVKGTRFQMNVKQWLRLPFDTSSSSTSNQDTESNLTCTLACGMLVIECPEWTMYLSAMG